ncbi:TPA: hypothetical protein ACH3X1_000641 [Trebouxia sp. C0004]
MLIEANCVYCNGTIGDVKVVKLLRKGCVVEAANYAITLNFAMILTSLSLQYNFVTSVVFVPKAPLLQQLRSMPDELARRTVNLDASYQSFDDTTKEMQRCVMQDRLSARKLSPIRSEFMHAPCSLLGMLMHSEQ